MLLPGVFLVKYSSVAYEQPTHPSEIPVTSDHFPVGQMIKIPVGSHMEICSQLYTESFSVILISWTLWKIDTGQYIDKERNFHRRAQ